MMIFDDNFVRDTCPVRRIQDIAPLLSLEHGASGITEFLFDRAGLSYQNGLYRIHAITNMQRWTEIAVEVFPDFRGRIFCFGFDWLGRTFALDFARKMNGQFLVLLLEPGTGQVLEIPVTFMDFHNVELVHYQNESLAAKFYSEWQCSGGKLPAFEQCVGYKKPLFLNGSDIVENLEVTDMEVYWSIAGQLLSNIRGFPSGTLIGNIHVSD